MRFQLVVLERWGYGRKHARKTGISALFAGPPGTGKTMAAEIVAGTLGLDLYRIDLSAVVSKYIGETEKNLERIFRAADQGDAGCCSTRPDILASAWRDARDRYANGRRVPVPATGKLRGPGRADDEPARQYRRGVHSAAGRGPRVSPPEEAERLQIWRRALPPESAGLATTSTSHSGAFKLAGRSYP